MQTRDDNGINPVMGTYNRSSLSFVRGDGAWLETDSGDKYLDFTTGIAVNSLGHGHPELVAALKSKPISSGMSQIFTLCLNSKRWQRHSLN